MRPATASTPEAVRQLRHGAARAQRAVTDFAAGRDEMQVRSQFWITNAVVVDVDTTRLPLEVIAQIPGVQRIHENFEVHPLDGDGPRGEGELADSVTQTHGDHTYGLELINVPSVWDQFGTQGEGARVAVLDTGIDPDHPDLDLAPDGWAEFDDTGNQIDSDPYDSDNHGTHVSGTVAGGAASGTHIGVAPGVELYHGGVLTDTGRTFGAVIGGIEWAVEANTDVINMSLGADHTGEFIESLQNAQAAGTLPISAIGNSMEGTSDSPGKVYGAGMSVGAVDDSEDVAYFSSGERVQKSDWSDSQSTVEEWPTEYIVPDVAAPGVGTYSSIPGNDYGTFQGTSMASPHVAGVACLMIAASNGTATPDQIWNCLEDTTTKPSDWDESQAEHAIDGKDTRYGKGIVDALAAVAQVSTAVTATATYSGGTAQISVDGMSVTQITVEDLWTDWAVADADHEPALSDEIATAGTCQWNWGDTTTVSPNLTIDIPEETYVGGEYRLTVQGANGGDTDETSVTFTIA
jgi:subtilisin family serine protease